MQLEVLPHDSLIAILQKCRQKKDLQQAKRLHAYLQEQNLHVHPLLGNYLVPMLVDCGNLVDGQKVFDRIPMQDRNQHSWNSLISGYIDLDDPDHAFHLYHLMQEHPDSVRPNRCTYLSVLNACARLKDFKKGHLVHGKIIQRGYEQHLFIGSAVVGNSLVDMYGKCGSLAEAQQVFQGLPIRNTVSWAALISGYADHGLAEEAKNCFQKMQTDGISPDSVTFVCILKGCSIVGALDIGRDLNNEVTKRGLDSDPPVGNTLVDMYIKCGSTEDARQVFDGLPVRDAISWNTLIAGYTNHGLGEEAWSCFLQMNVDGLTPDSITFACILKACSSRLSLETGQGLHHDITKRGLEKELYVGNALVDMYIKFGLLGEAHHGFHRLPSRDGVSWNTLIAGYAEQGLDDEVLDCFTQMQQEGVSADPITFASCLKACGTVGVLERGREIHAEIRKWGLETDPFMGSLLIDMYGKCGSVAEGREVFDNLPVRDVVSWTAMVQAYGENHEGNMAIQCFEDMQEQGIKPNSVTFTCLLAACSHASLVLKGQEYFKVMRECYQMEPTMDHYACMVDLLARSGHVYEAERFVAAMRCPPSSFILMALLSSCKIYEKVELGERCFQQLMEADQDIAAASLLMADIYASAGRCDDAKRVEGMRKGTGASKRIGSATVEVNKELHEYLVGANLNMSTLELLEIQALRLKDEAYVPNLDLFLRQTFDDKSLTC